MKKNKVEHISDMLVKQKSFSENFFEHKDLTQSEKEHLTMVFSASMQKEIGSLLEGINYRQHRLVDKPANVNTILHESVDIFRYLLGILNLWDIDANQFIDAFNTRDVFLNTRHDKEKIKWENQPVLIVDIDDVLSTFRRNCTTWVKKYHNENIDETSKAYYHISEELFHEFVNDRQMSKLDVFEDRIQAINELYDAGYWIHLLTARPKEDLVCKYDTYLWLEEKKIKFHRVSFSPEKYLWLAKTDYYKTNSVVCAIDDSPKHVLEYVKHGVECISPITEYNQELKETQGVEMFISGTDMKKLIEAKYNKKIGSK